MFMMMMMMMMMMTVVTLAAKFLASRVVVTAFRKLRSIALGCSPVE